jgi:hypothetical protein
MVPMGWGMMQDWWYEFNSEMTTFQDAEYTMMAFKTDANELGTFWPVYDQSASYIVATYPTVRRLEFAVQTQNGENFGYHIMESWNTEDDIMDWTLSVTTGDVDSDGKGEVIVGDYDNNIYVFEHMLNNTYKRAFRSWDINHTEVSNSSPYMWEELEGIEGTFNRVIWDHVEHILADCDLDGDGYKELIAAAGLQVYVFEDTGIDDTYDLAYMFDMRNNPNIQNDEWEHVTKVTTIGAGDDYDLNGQKELLIAAGPFLFVYDIPFDSWTYQHEYFMRSGGNPEGRHYLLGNGALEDFEKAWIQTMALCDVDEDGYREIIIGGRVNVTQMREDGFLKVYEWKGVSFVEVWEAPPEVTTWNPVTSVAIDDQDFDSHQEIIIGHTKGFDIWEWNGDDDGYVKVDIVTSSPNYPIVPLQTTRQGNDIFNEQYLQTDRGDSDISYMSWAPSSPIMGVFTQIGGAGGDRLYYKIYDPALEEWGAATQIYFGDYGYGPSNIEEYEPSLFLHTGGTLYLVWRADSHYSGGDAYHFYISYWNPGGGNWVAPVRITLSYSEFHFPALFQWDDGHLGLVFTNNYPLLHVAGWIDSTAWDTWGSASVLAFKNWVYFEVYSTDILNIPGAGYALAISGRNRTLAKTDLDIFVAISNRSFIWSDSPMYQATSSYNNEVNPDLGILAAPERSLMVVYESVESDIEDRIQMSYSNSYTMWRQSEPLATLPPYTIRTELPGNQVVYHYNETRQMLAPIALCPSVLGLRSGGFMQMHTFDFFTRGVTPLSPSRIRENSIYDEMKYDENSDLLWGINPSSRFTHFYIRGVTELDVGDTDGDNRREVIVGFDNRAGIYELAHSNVGGGIMEHEEVWLSNPFLFDVTGVSVYDSNGNEFEEIAVSCQRGEVYIYEIEDSGTDRVHLKYSDKLWVSSIGGAAAHSGSPGSGFHTVEVFDLDADGKDEIIRGEVGGVIRAIDDDGSELWANGDFGGSAFYIAVGVASGTPFVSVMRVDGWLTVINGVTGATNANQRLDTFLWGSVGMGNIVAGTGDDVIATNSTGYVVAMTIGGSPLWTTQVSTVFTNLAVTVGNFSGRAQNDVAVVHANGSVTFLYGNNGTVFYHENNSTGSAGLTSIAADINRDGIDDLVTGDEHLWVLDPKNKSIIYNSTVYSPPFNSDGTSIYDLEWLWVDDFDDDSMYEVIGATRTTVYYEELSSGRMVWSYQPDTEIIFDAKLGNFIDGRLGVGIATDDGWLVALDALTGVPVFFDSWPTYEYNQMAVGDFNGDGIDEIAGSDDSSGDFRAVTVVEPWVPAPLEAFDYWTVYWNETSNNWIRGLWTYDLDNDGVDDFLRAHSDGSLALFDPIYPSVEWFRGLDAYVHDIQFLEFTGDGIFDCLVLAEKSGSYFVLGLDGATGAEIPSITKIAPPATRINVIAVADFNTAEPGTEFVVLYTDATNYTWAEFYANDGGFKAMSSFNATSFYPTDAVVGRLDVTADAAFDIMVSGISFGADGDVFSWEGDGTYIGSFPGGYPLIVDMAVGNFDGDAQDDMVMAFDVGWLMSWEIGTSFYVGMINNTIDSIGIVDLVGMGTFDEIAVNVREEGVVVYDSLAFTEIWRFTAPTVVPKEFMFEDIDGDGTIDLALSCYNRVALYDIARDEIFGVYTADGLVLEMKIGNFDDLAPLDVLFYSGTETFCITDGTVPPIPPFSATGLDPLAMLVGVVVVGSVIVAIPVSYGIGLPLWIRRKRRLLEN